MIIKLTKEEKQILKAFRKIKCSKVREQMLNTMEFMGKSGFHHVESSTVK